MDLTEEQKKTIEAEEAYRAQVRSSSFPNKKRGIGCLGAIVAFVFAMIVLGTVMTMYYPQGNSNNNATPTETVTEVDKNRLAQTFCDERSKSFSSSVNLVDFIKMYENPGTTVTLRRANAKPSIDNCKKIIDICIKSWDKEECKDIAEKKIWIGMDRDQLILSWGIAKDENNSTYSFGVHSQWVYGDFGSYVYLEGKTEGSMKVTSWQD